MKTVLIDHLAKSKKLLLEHLHRIINLIPESQNKIESDTYDFWNNSESDAKLRDLSHLKGQGRWADLDEWYKIGTKHLNMLDNVSKYLNRNEPINYILEWGTGGGANAVHFCQNIEKYYGVDISEYNLKQCRTELENNGYNNFIPIKIDVDNPESCLKFLDQKIDFFLSTAVYQHFPS